MNEATDTDSTMTTDQQRIARLEHRLNVVYGAFVFYAFFGVSMGPIMLQMVLGLFGIHASYEERLATTTTVCVLVLMLLQMRRMKLDQTHHGREDA